MRNFIGTIKKKNLDVPSIIWIGQAGFIVKSKNGQLLAFDLYLSDCVEPLEGHVGYHRLMPKILHPKDVDFDIVIASHFHRDHFDIDSMVGLMDNDKTQLFCAYDCIKDVDQLNLDKDRVTYVRPGDVCKVGDFKLSFINSDHGEGAPLAVGVIISVDNRRIVYTADTCLHLDWVSEYQKDGPIDVLVAPINGAYGNLNEADNVALTKALAPEITIPCHFGMFPSHGGNPGLWKELLEKEIPSQRYTFLTQGEEYVIEKNDLL